MAVAGVALVAAGLAPGSASSSHAATSLGTATADATTFQVDPRQAQLSVGITFGTADATYTNDTARASSQGVNLGTIGTTLAAEGCDGGAPTLPADKQPQPLVVDSRDPGAVNGRTANTMGLFDQQAKASSQPWA